MKIRNFFQDDYAVVKSIYQQGIDTGHATFQQQAKDWAEWDESTLPECRLVAELNGEVVGWAALSPVSTRCVYSGVAEISVYIATDHSGKGIGQLLLSTLVTCSEEAGFWTLTAGIFPENVASIAIHEKCGFRKLGVRHKLGKMKGKWRDVVVMERRSSKMELTL